jgi:hypothetical protein
MTEYQFSMFARLEPKTPLRFFHLSVNEYVRGLLKYFLDSATLLI